MQVEFRENYDIKKHTTFKIGGLVHKVWFPKTQEELVYLLKTLEDYILLGNCSNQYNYEYTQKDVDKMFSAIDTALKASKVRFTAENSNKDTRFKF